MQKLGAKRRRHVDGGLIQKLKLNITQARTVRGPTGLTLAATADNYVSQ
jgi:hypothetical protein